MTPHCRNTDRNSYILSIKNIILTRRAYVITKLGYSKQLLTAMCFKVFSRKSDLEEEKHKCIRFKQVKELTIGGSEKGKR